MHRGAIIFPKRRPSLLAECYFSVKALTLHFKEQELYMSTSFTFGGKQPFVTTLFYYELSLHPFHIKSNLHS